jgi:NADH-quinone oxidoreductase subunit L
MSLDVLSHFLWIIPALNLLACLSIASLYRVLRSSAHWFTIATVAASAVLSTLLLIHLYGEQNEAKPLVYSLGSWLQIGSLTISLNLQVDPLTAAMLFTINFVGTWIAVFSAAYMDKDPGFARYFAIMSLFIFCMCGLVLTTNLVILFVFWEGVGVCSYLLIGYWIYKRSAAGAALKAFLVTRLGDAGFILGILLIWFSFGATFEYTELFTKVSQERAQLVRDARPTIPVNTDADMSESDVAQTRLNSFDTNLFIICLLLLCGAFGKSAQFPFHVWLPEAMEGPTPVSALIHAATMVTAGVYLIARLTPLFVLSQTALLVVACIGAFTALLAALIALTQTDLKRILAYSTVSQLGYMFLALGAMDSKLGSLAVGAALFHLMTHAFFKALLFLSAGSIMHSTANIIDIRSLGGLRRAMPITHIAFLVGALCLAGIIPFSGFWSKDNILELVLERADHDQTKFAYIYYLLFGSAVVTAGLTALYIARAYFLTFWGQSRLPHEVSEHVHESSLWMVVPLVVLSLGATFAGLFGSYLDVFNEQFNTLWQVPHASPTHEIPHAPNYSLIISTTLISIVAILVAYFMFGRNQDALTADEQTQPGVLQEFSYHGFYIDAVYAALIVLPLTIISKTTRVIEQTFNGIVNILVQLPKVISSILQVRALHNGFIQFYGVSMLLGTTIFIVFMLMMLRMI